MKLGYEQHERPEEAVRAIVADQPLGARWRLSVAARSSWCAVASEGNRYESTEGIRDDADGEELVGVEQSPHVLLVAPRASDRRLLRAALAGSAGSSCYRCSEMASVEHATAALIGGEGKLPDVLLLSLGFAQDGALRLLDQLGDHFGEVPLPVVVITGAGDREAAGRAVRCGAQDHVEQAKATPELLPRVIRNAVERFDLLQRLRASERQAARANRAKSSFLANISHEIRTPMTAILGFTDLLVESEADPERRRLLAMIRENGDYLVELLGDVLDLSKIEAGTLDVAPSLCQPAPLIHAIAGSLGGRAQDKGLAFHIEIDNSLPDFLWTDPIRVRQVLINLVSNAVKFTERGMVVVSARARRDSDPPELEVSVSDTGVGIAKDKLDDIFTPFVQVDASSSRRAFGAGLGLAISRRLAEALGGSLTVDSRLGKGSCFCLTIPIHDVPAGAWPHRPEERRAEAERGERDGRASSGAGRRRRSTPAGSAPLAGRRLLLAEDTRALQLLVRRILQSAGAEVEVVENGRQAVERVLRSGTSYDAVLMDMQMPGMDGYEATAVLRQSDFRRPIIAVTASALRGDQSECLSAGCDGYLPKPIDRHALITEILRLVAAPARHGHADARVPPRKRRGRD